MRKHKTRPDTALWAAVDQITQPTTRRIQRDERREAVDSTVIDIRCQERDDRLVPADLARYSAMTSGHAQLPSLWGQAVEALATSNADQADGGGGGSVHRSPCDLELLDQLALIRRTLAVHLGVRRLNKAGSVPDQLRRLAAHIATNEADDLARWTARIQAWARALAHHLQIVQAQPKPRRIRGVACPECQVTSVVLEQASGERVSVPPIVIDFLEGQIRAAECSGCGAVLAWRGEQMWQLADRIRGRHA